MDASKMDALETLVGEVDRESPAAQAEQQQAATEAEAAELEAKSWGMIAYTVGGALSMLCPELRQVYSENACLDWGRAVVPVAEKYGWNGPGGVPELGLLIATAGLAVPSVLVIREKLRQMAEERDLATARERAKRNAGAPTFENEAGAPDGG